MPDTNYLQLRSALESATAPQNITPATPRALLVFAHPDDEMVGLGARIGRYGGGCLAHATDGAPRNEQDSRAHGFANCCDYAAGREAELAKALEMAGIPDMERVSFGIPDQEASLALVDLTRRILALIEARQPEVILTHPYEGGHPDHDACAFAVRHAVSACLGCTGDGPQIIECAFYHAGGSGIETGSFLPGPGDPPEVTYDLTPEEQARKRALMQCFSTQTETLSYFSLAQERFRIAPHYDFTRPPHSGPAFYNDFPWGMEAQRFCKLAAQAEAELGGEEPAG